MHVGFVLLQFANGISRSVAGSGVKLGSSEVVCVPVVFLVSDSIVKVPVIHIIDAILGPRSPRFTDAGACHGVVA